MGHMKDKWIEQMEPKPHEWQRRWIPVSERLPELVERVMVCNANDGWVMIGSRELTGTYHHWDGDDYEELCEPTHWMPLPEPPH